MMFSPVLARRSSPHISSSSSITTSLATPRVLLLLLLLAVSGAELTRAEDLVNDLLSVEDQVIRGGDGELLVGEEMPRSPPQVLELDDVRGSAEEDLDEEGRDKRAPSGFMGLRGKKAPSGFLGMRGRRTEEGEDQQYQDWTGFEPLGAAADKRAPYGFVGMRGKKAPSGFLGMRGKKAPSGFLGLRGKKEVPQNLNDLLLALSTRYRNNYGYKRAPLGFMGMRGRRSGPSLSEGGYGGDTDLNGGLDKRAPMGFMGMRG